MLSFWLMLLVITVALMVLLWVGTLFIQGYIYTEPTPQLYWQAPAAGAVLGGFFALWCYCVATTPGANKENIPYDTLVFMTPRVDMLKEPAKELWAIKKNDERALYKSHRKDQRRWEYKDAKTGRPWNGTGVQAVEITNDNERIRFELEKPADAGAYPRLVNDKGWIMTVGDYGPTGSPTIFRTGRFLANLFFNFMHLGLWFLCLWLILRFQWPHALGIGFCLWLGFMLAVLPMLLAYAGEVAAGRPA